MAKYLKTLSDKTKIINRINNNYFKDCPLKELLIFHGNEQDLYFKLANWKGLQQFNIPLNCTLNDYKDTLRTKCDNNIELHAISMRNKVLFALDIMDRDNYYLEYHPQKIYLKFHLNQILCQINNPSVNNGILSVIDLDQIKQN